MSKNKPLVIAFVGIEGVGKTWATNFFTKKYQTFMAKEYGNWYIKNILKNYYDAKTHRFLTTKKDFFAIVEHQQAIWKETLAKAAAQRVCFFDTDFIYTKYFIDKQFYNWNWIDFFLPHQPIDLFIFIDSIDVKTKAINLLKPEYALQEKQVLFNYYQRFACSKIVKVRGRNYQTRILKIAKIIANFLSQHNE